MSQPLLSVENLAVEFRNGGQAVRAVDGVSFRIAKGECFALVGESGSGKTVTALSVLRLLVAGGRIVGGKAALEGTDLFRLSEWDMCRVRGSRVGVVFQDPMTFLNPVLTVGRQIAEAVALHRGLKGDALRTRVVELLDMVGLPDPQSRYGAYPHQLSGGQRQRVMIAIALAGEPDLLIADEPTTALDVTLQVQILGLLKELQQRTGMALWLITHDLGVVAQIADRVAVMQSGRIVEQAPLKTFFERPQHEYTQKLLNSLPTVDGCGRRPAPEERRPLLAVEDFRVYYPVRKGVFQRVVDHVKAVDGVSFELEPGSTLALVGESGCGKSTLGKSLLGLIPHHAGAIRFDGEDVTVARGEKRRRLCARMQIVFQDPYSSMNPRLIVGDIVAEGLDSLFPDMTRDERRERVERLLVQVGLPPEARLRYPHEFSGGQRQRICIARALAVEPKLLVCDEPTSALDVSVQAQIIRLLKQLQDDHGLSYLFISHDLAVVAELAHRVAVMRQGRVVEQGDARQVLLSPGHDYTRRLLAAVPRLPGRR
ncbi:ABC transporter ATP-binding protein [Methylogaea oryzae]|uniref:ABC transporter ATP-binding protein n=1 Tax=Methylogaea oryzae TaxID=1295382 RepID=A0A8D4VPJ9_9GAMM|nr:dipeptide ABC transporter ATP-binding protein [Methylogaea oryzae]BBL71347.1 ABC transporter ATP-binding protein [Methylogaea oryzae]